MKQTIKTEMISRRKAVSLLGFGAASGFTLSSALEPSEAEAQETTTPAAAPPAATGTEWMQRRSRGGALVAISDDTRAAPVNPPPPQNSSSAIGGASAFPGVDRAVRGLSQLHIRSADHAIRETADERKGGNKSIAFPQIHVKRSCDGGTAETRISGGLGSSYQKHDMFVWVRGSATKTHSNQDRTFGAMVRAPSQFCQARGSSNGIRPSRNGA